MRRAGRQSLFLLVPAIVLCGSANGQAETPATSQPTLDKWAQHYYDRVARFKAETVRPGGVVLVGSSHIEGLDAETWLPRWDVVNRGISSDRIGLTERGILHRLDCSVFDCQPGIIVIQNGANDLGELWRHGTPSIDEIATCYAEVVRRIRTKLPDVPLLISGLKPTRDRYAGLVPLLVELDGRLKQIAADQGCPFIEVYGDLAGDDGLLRPELSRDGLHLTPAGYALWARRLDGALTRASRAADGSLIASLVTREPDSDLRWFDARQLCSEGKAWDDTEKFYERLPARAEAEVTEPVWNLSKNTAGLAVRFITDSKRIGAIWDGGGAMNHMAATGNSGLDLYVRRADGWVFMGVGKPSRERTTTTLARGLSGEPAEYLLYLPLYHAVSELRIGIVEGALLKPAPPREMNRARPIVFYGTSITQGGCASRAGMCHAAILGRWLDREVINLGFSGAGKMEPAMATLLGELDPAVYVLECLPNMTPEMVTERVPPFVLSLRQRRPDTPILLVANPNLAEQHRENEALREARDALQQAGVSGLHYLASTPQLAGDEDGTVDGVHPTDLGFYRMATAYRPVLDHILGKTP